MQVMMGIILLIAGFYLFASGTKPQADVSMLTKCFTGSLVIILGLLFIVVDTHT